MRSGFRTAIPAATYRLQLTRDFTFEQAIAIVDYLQDLGISDVYSSPVLQAGPWSTHGYDVCSFEVVNPGLGGESGYSGLTQKLREQGLGLLLDFVPNHMGTDCSNSWLIDVLGNGSQSQFGSWFDIDWESPVPGLKGKVLLPILEELYGKVLEAGKLRLAREADEFELQYYDRAFPLRRETQEQLGAEVSAKGLEAVLAAYNGKEGFDALNGLIEQQHYRLGWWRLAGQILNYRRFFDVTELMAVRMELPQVFSAAHRLVLSWCKNGQVTGLRIDHPDGLFDPRQYFDRLQRTFGNDDGENRQPLYIVAEKILSGDERLPADWPVAGTTGYDFLNQVNGLFVDPAKEATFTDLYRDFCGYAGTFEEAAFAGKKKVVGASFCGELDGLARSLLEIAAETRTGHDLTFHSLQAGLAEIIAAFPVYRTYVTGDTKRLSEIEQRHVELALDKARQQGSAIARPAIDWIGAMLVLHTPGDLSPEAQARCRHFVRRFQQLTGPVTAKGVEDTAFYNYNRLVSLNEVGGDPGRFGVSVQAFHEYNEVTAQSWPHSLLATATHDTKRGEDVRARLNVLSEMPDQWSAALQSWKRLNQGHKTEVAGQPAPDANDEYLLYQTLLGAWPDHGDSGAELKLFCDRVNDYMLKALREAKRNTSWTEPEHDYEHATKTFVERVLDRSFSEEFHAAFELFQKTISFFGRFNSLSQTLLKLTSPGVPDIYQGTELWDLSLVDPDNRRPVDYAARRAALGRVKHWDRLQITEISADTKIFIIHRALHLRNRYRDLFDQGAYLPLRAEGDQKNHLCAFARRKDNLLSITIVPRLVYGLMNGEQRRPVGDIWGDTVVRLPQQVRLTEVQEVFTGQTVRASGDGTIPVSSILRDFPVALLCKAG